MSDIKTTEQGVTRRDFIVRSTVIAGSGFLSIGLPGLVASKEAQAAVGGQAFTPSIWFTMTPDGKTTMHILKAEMGQHIGTGLAQVIAEELEVNWDDVRLDTPVESATNFSVYGLAYTVNSGSITTEFDRIARAGAAGRMALVEARLVDCIVNLPAKLFLNTLSQHLHRMGFTMNQCQWRSVFKMPVPINQARLIGMRRQPAHSMYFGLHPQRFSPQPDMFGTVNQQAPQGTLCLVADDHDMAMPAPNVVFKMVFDAPTGAHAATGNDDRTALDGIDRHRFFRRAGVGEYG